LHATVDLARKAREAGVRRFVFASSCSMYGSAASEDLVGEDAPLRPLTAYAESKVRAEEALAELSDDHFAPVFMRNATAYGASPRFRFDVVLNNLAAWAYTTGKVMIMSDGTPWRPLVHVEDITRASAAALTASRDVVAGEAFNVGANSENYRVSELAEIVRDTFPNCAIEYAEGAGPDPRSYRVDFGKFLRTFPDAAPRWTARDGAQELLGAFDAVRLSEADFDRYTRLVQLKRLRDEGALDEDLRWSLPREPVNTLKR
jgi:nucleoside-diphosphate-sugar epimerase